MDADRLFHPASTSASPWCSAPKPEWESRAKAAEREVAELREAVREARKVMRVVEFYQYGTTPTPGDVITKWRNLPAVQRAMEASDGA